MELKLLENTNEKYKNINDELASQNKWILMKNGNKWSYSCMAQMIFHVK